MVFMIIKSFVVPLQEDSQDQRKAERAQSWKWPLTLKPSTTVHQLLCAMLHPDPASRADVQALATHPWLEAEHKTALGRAQYQRQHQASKCQEPQSVGVKSIEKSSSSGKDKDNNNSKSGKVQEKKSTSGKKSSSGKVNNKGKGSKKGKVQGKGNLGSKRANVAKSKAPKKSVVKSESNKK